MTDLDNRLDQALKAGAPAPRDAMFRIEVMARRERAAARRRLGLAMGMAAGVAILAALALSVGLDIVRQGQDRLPFVIAFAIVAAGALAAATAVMSGAFGPAMTAWRVRAGAAPRLRLWS